MASFVRADRCQASCSVLSAHKQGSTGSLLPRVYCTIGRRTRAQQRHHNGEQALTVLRIGQWEPGTGLDLALIKS